MFHRNRDTTTDDSIVLLEVKGSLIRQTVKASGSWAQLRRELDRKFVRGEDDKRSNGLSQMKRSREWLNDAKKKGETLDGIQLRNLDRVIPVLVTADRAVRFPGLGQWFPSRDPRRSMPPPAPLPRRHRLGIGPPWETAEKGHYVDYSRTCSRRCGSPSRRGRPSSRSTCWETACAVPWIPGCGSRAKASPDPTAASPARTGKGPAMDRRLISTGSPFEHSGGYSRAVAVDRWVFVSATSGYDYTTMTVSEDVIEQTRQTLRNITSALEQAGASLKDVVRVQVFVAEADEWPRISGVFAEVFREIRPALTATVCGMIVPRIKLEIEALAMKA